MSRRVRDKYEKKDRSEEEEALLAEMPVPGRPAPHVPAKMNWGGRTIVRLIGESVAEDGDVYVEYLGEPDRTWHTQEVRHGTWPHGIEVQYVRKGYLYRNRRELGMSEYPYRVADRDLVLEDHARALPEPKRVLVEPEPAAESFRGIDRSKDLRPAPRALREPRSLEEAERFSAALAAKPAEPRGVQVYCQGDWWDGLENL